MKIKLSVVNEDVEGLALPFQLSSAVKKMQAVFKVGRNAKKYLNRAWISRDVDPIPVNIHAALGREKTAHRALSKDSPNL